MSLKDFKNAIAFMDTLKIANYPVALTGAGISRASGIPDFRSPDGLYSFISQQTFDIEFFYSDPKQYYKIARKHIHQLAEKQPNINHSILAKLQEKNYLKTIITQNIDGLHQKAGSKNVIEFHGNVLDFHCTSCQKSFDIKTVNEKIDKKSIPLCSCGELIRPDIVFFGDPIPPKAIQASQELLEKTDLFIVLGSSLSVEPAASLARAAKNYNAKLIIITLGKTIYDKYADLKLDVNLEKFSSKLSKLIK